ncbi:MAG TPA: alpha/beta fold hydrolase, partial [Acidobacteriota bacterium]
RLAQVTTQKYFGTYEKAPGKHLYIRTWDELGPDQLTYYDDDGRIGALFPESTTSFTSGPGIWIPLPASVKATFTFNAAGEAAEVIWSESGSAPGKFKKVPIHNEQEVTFTNGNVTLAGSLVVPRGSGPHPAIVLVHGSGPVTRDFFGPIAYLLAKHGFAVLSYDKRGNGKSGGDWLDADFEDLAADALSAVALLKSRAEINAKKIGLLGISQGGWIVPLAASKSTDIVFAVLISTPSVSPAQQEIQRVEEEMQVQKATPDQIKETIGKLSADLDSLRKQETVESLQSEIERLKAEGNDRLLKMNGPENPRFLLFYNRIMDFDPLPILQKMNRPVLVLYGEADRGVPVKGNLDKLVNALKQAKDVRYSVRVFPKGNHALLLSETGSYEEFFHLNRFVPEFFSTLIDWLRKL